jgi:PEP-CTERM motif
MKSLLVLAAALGFAAPAAWAAPPDASGTFNYDVSLTLNTIPASHSFACGTVSIDAAPLPTVSALGTGGCTSVLQAIFSYYVEIVGPANVPLPITVASTATLSATGAAQAGFSLGVGSQTIGIGNCYFASLAACGTHSTSTSMVMMTNQLYAVGMMADVSNFLGAGSGSAVVDPQFFFDGDFAPEYAFAFSPGVGNGVTVGVVPEPETLALMLAGLAAGSIALRRRRRDRA